MLTFEIELPTGAYRASLGDRAEWPPHPDRFFCALVQAWADGGEDPAERAALEWLELQVPPLVGAAQEYHERDTVTVYVPPNDARGNKLDVLPEFRRRQARGPHDHTAFRAAVPASDVVRFHWGVEPDADIRDRLAVVAGRVATLGHSTSIVRCALADESTVPDRGWQPDPEGPDSLRVTYEGRLSELERSHKQGERPRMAPGRRYRPIGGELGKVQAESVFGGAADWSVFEDAGGSRPDILGFPIVARRLRDALMSLSEQPPPALLSGHERDGAPLQVPHAAIVPLCNVGWPHSTGDLLGFGIILPRETAAEDRAALLQVLSSFVRPGEEEDRMVGRLQVLPESPWWVEHSPFPEKSSVSPARYCRTSRVWASTTPVVLDRFPKSSDSSEEAAIVASSCLNIGLPEPAEIELHKYSAVAASPPAYPARGTGGIDWSIPSSAPFRNRPRRHVVLRFAEGVRGPVILGAARYHGLGLCLPVDEARQG